MKRRRRKAGRSARQGASAIFLLWIPFAVLMLVPQQARGAEKMIWQIGKPDHASLEFNSRWDFSQGKDPRFIVGQSNPAEDWSAFHPGTAASGAGWHIYPFTILFSLDNDPRGVYYLTVAAMFRSPAIPEYFIEVNAKKGRFYFHPQLTYETGDPETAWNIIFSVQSVRVALPAAYFRKGENQIILTCGADGGLILLPNSKVSGGTPGIYYDALQLTQDSEAKPAALTPTASAVPTIFYRRQANNQLSEVVVLKATAHGPYEHGSASLKLEKEKPVCEFKTGYDFGESECPVEVPELAGPTPARLTVTLGQRSITREVLLAPQKKWKLFLCPQMHLDMGYTDYRPNSYEVHNRNIDQIIATMESRPDYKFNPDGSFIFEDYWKHRGEEWRERCLKVLREGRLAFPAQLFTINSGLASQEELYRLAYFSAQFSREHNLPLVYADQTDVPAHSWALPSVLNGMGLKYLAISSNPWRGPILLHGRLHEKSPFWWQGPDGKKILTWFSRQYAQLEQLFTHQPYVLAGVNSLPIFLQAYGAPAYAGDAIMLYGTQSDNVPFAPEEVGFPDEWNNEFDYPQIRTSTMADFFEYMERNFANSFSTLRGDGGAWWEEMAAADAFYAGMARKAKERALAAEEAASIASIANPGFHFPLLQDRAIWNSLLLYTEHTWGTPRAWYRPESDPAAILQRDKESFSWQAEIETDHLLRRGLSQLANKVYTKGDTVVVFNPLSWRRGGLLELELDRGQGLVDSKTHQPVPLELIRRDKDEQYDRVRFWVDEVPPLGFHCYEITASGAAAPASDLPVSNSFENEFYRIVVDPSRGGIASIFDKQLGKELVDRGSHYALDQYVYAGYGHEGLSLIQQRTRFNSTLLQYSTALPRPNLNVSTGGRGKVVGARKVPWGTILILESSTAYTPKIQTELRLLDKAKRLDLVNTVEKEVVRAPEGVYFAFPFAGERPMIRYEIQDAWVDPTKDQLPGANKEWFSGQHWISVTNPGLSIAIAFNEAPLFTIGDIDRGRWPETLEVANGTVFSYIMDNYDGDDERPFQGGTYTFRYTLSSFREFDPAELARFGREVASPLEFEKVTRAAKHDSPPEPLTQPETGFISIESKEVVLSTWKAAEDDEGYVLRFYNTTDKPTTARISLPNLELDRIFRVNGLEVNQEAVTTDGAGFALLFAPHEIVSVRILGFKLK